MKNKKTAVITFRTSEEIKEALNDCATQNQWTQAQVVEQLCKNFLANPEPYKITIWVKDLLNIVKEIEAEGCGAVELSIDPKFDETTQRYYKELNANGLECGGMGCIMFDAYAEEIKESEYADIP